MSTHVIRRFAAAAVVTATTIAMPVAMPLAAQARPSGVVVEATGTKVAPKTVTVTYSLKGSAVLTMVVQRVRGTAATVAHVHSHTGIGSLTWNRHFQGRPATPGRYVVTLVANKGSATSSSSIMVTLN